QTSSQLRSSMTGSSHSSAYAPQLQVRLSLTFPWRLQLQASRVWDAGRKQSKRLKSRVETERWELRAERPAVAQRKGRTQPGQGVTSGGQAKRNGVGKEKRWQRLAREKETKRKVQLERPKLKETQIMKKETRDLNHNLLRGKVAQAFEKRSLKGIEGKKKRQDELIARSKLMSFSKRLAVEQKLQRSQEILDQLMEERIRESKEKALKEEEQSFMAKFRAKEKVEEKRRHKRMLLNIAERKIQQDPEMLAKTIQQKVKHIKEINCLKERKKPPLSKTNLDYDERCQLQEIEAAISRRDQRSDLALRGKESVGEKVRKNTHSVLWPETKRDRTDEYLNK
uniref:Uncharacterized protein n=1 Tax=Accipiter nisus TaxID=211598 RepID=A0A8B9S196_9AVES